jgi:hypothetical protein
MVETPGRCISCGFLAQHGELIRSHEHVEVSPEQRAAPHKCYGTASITGRRDAGLTSYLYCYLSKADLLAEECIQEATNKYEASERIYRRCMHAKGWERARTQYPTYRQFRGPESEDALFSPPDPLSKRGPEPRRVSDPTCAVGRPTSRPEHCRRQTVPSPEAPR